MRNVLDEIKESVQAELDSFNKLFLDFLKEDKISILNQTLMHIHETKGKQIRPVFLFLLYKMISNKPSDKLIENALNVEILHLASLIHDDVVDNSDKRRNKATVNSLWGNSVAVLLGDYIFSKILENSVKTKNYEMLELGTNVIVSMAKGEMLQIEKKEALDIKEEDYFNIVYWKTGCLFEVCGKAASNALENEINKQNFAEIGHLIGNIFQIKDDILDYYSTSTGKPLGNDIVERKITLPLIYALNNVDNQTREDIIRKIGSQDNRQYISEIVDFVNNNCGTELANKKILEFKKKIFDILEKYPESEYKNKFTKLIEFLIARDL